MSSNIHKDDIKKIILRTVADNNMIDCGDTIIVGVSGGADSMCLLHFLMSIRAEYSLKIIAAHINHGLRGAEALRDQLSVEKYCCENNIECRVLTTDINKISKKTGEGSEECGRRIRYGFFNELAGESGKIATAHTLSDSAETIIFHLARGTGLKGLTGIPRVRGKVIRPLINITRTQVEEYCKKNSIGYVTDSTNLTDEYSRNKIRHTVLPALKNINPAAEAAIQRLSEIVQEQLSLIDSLADEFAERAKIKNGYSCKIILKANPIVVKQFIINILKGTGCNSFEERHILLIMDIIKSGGAVQLPKGFTASAKQGVFRVYNNKRLTSDSGGCADNAVMFPSGDSTFVVNKQKITVKFMTKEEYDKIKGVHKFLVNNALDYDIIHGETLFRARRSGDTFSQCGRGVTKTVKKLFIEEKIPQEQRGGIVLLAYGSRVLWIKGFGAAQGCGVTENTKTVAAITAEEI